MGNTTSALLTTLSPRPSPVKVQGDGLVKGPLIGAASARRGLLEVEAGLWIWVALNLVAFPTGLLFTGLFPAELGQDWIVAFGSGPSGALICFSTVAAWLLVLFGAYHLLGVRTVTGARQRTSQLYSPLILVLMILVFIFLGGRLPSVWTTVLEDNGTFTVSRLILLFPVFDLFVRACRATFFMLLLQSPIPEHDRRHIRLGAVIDAAGGSISYLLIYRWLFVPGIGVTEEGDSPFRLIGFGVPPPLDTATGLLFFGMYLGGPVCATGLLLIVKGVRRGRGRDLPFPGVFVRAVGSLQRFLRPPKEPDKLPAPYGSELEGPHTRAIVHSGGREDDKAP